MAEAGGINWNEHLPALQVAVPLTGAMLAAIVREGRAAWAVSLLACWAMPVISISLLVRVMESGPISYAMGGWEPPIGIEYRIDQANAYVMVFVSAMAALVMTYMPRSTISEIRTEKHGWYYACFLLCLTGLEGMLASGDAFNIFVFMEISSLSMYVLIALGSDRRAVVAAYQYLIIGTLGATFYVIGVGLLLTMTGTLNLVDIAVRLDQVENSRPIVASMAFIVVGLGLKIALFPMHLWLPNAYAFAPSAASAFIASTATKVAVYLLLRYLFSVFGIETSFGETPAAALFLVLAVVAMIVASAVAIFQRNVKRMLAYSSVAQIGYIMLGVGLVSQLGLTGGVAHLFNHAIIKGCLFLAIGCMVFATGITRVESMAGIGRTMPVTMGAFVIAGLGLIGVPGTAGFISKWYLVQAAIEAGMWWIAAAIVVSSMLAVVYVGRVVEIAWFRPPSRQPASAPPVEMVAVTVLLAAATLYFGIFTDFSGDVAAEAARVLFGGYPR